MSYEADNPWSMEVKTGIETVLGQTGRVEYFYMNTKKNLPQGSAKAAEAYRRFKAFKPHGVIAVDDPAQSMFVLPFLHQKENVPVMFCGVNADPQQYGYPTPQISGILERNFIGQSIAMAKQFVPAIATVGFLSKNSPSGRAIRDQVRAEAGSYMAKITRFELVEDIAQTLAAIDRFKQSSDLLFVGATNGILDQAGNPLNNRQVTRIIAKAFGKPMIGANKFHVQFGVLCAVVKSGHTQGMTAAQMLIKALGDVPVSDLPIAVNRHGRKMLNITVMKQLGIKPKRRALLGVELLETTP